MSMAPTGEFDPDERVRTAGVVLNYCTPELALQAATTLARDLDAQRDRVVIVDNQSPDDSYERLSEALAALPERHIKLVRAPRNGGFAYGNNFGVRSIFADEYLLVNSDTIVTPGAVDALRRALHSSGDIGIVGPRLQFEDEEPQVSCFRRHSPVSELIRGAQTGPVTRFLKRWDVPLGVQSKRVDVEWISFAFVMVRREVFDEVGMLDEGFFMYYEDADFCNRTRRAGYRIVHDPEGRVVHLRGKSSPVKEATRLRKPRPRYYYDSRNRYYRRTYGPAGPFLANFLWSLGRVVALPREAVGHKKPHVVEREFRDNWKGSLSLFSTKS